jgi:hypothetical protein
MHYRSIFDVSETLPSEPHECIAHLLPVIECGLLQDSGFIHTREKSRAPLFPPKAKDWDMA